MEFYGVHFSLPPDMDSFPLPAHCQLIAWPPLERLLKDLLETHRRPDALSRWRENVLTQQLLCEIFTLRQTEALPTAARRIQRVLRSIREDPFRPLTPEQLAGEAGLHKTLFFRSFREITGTTPLQYITGLRLECARDLLLETALPAARIAEQCGFADPLYFSRCFKKKYGIAPSVYRAQESAALSR